MRHSQKRPFESYDDSRWYDKELRPFDAPICDWSTPKAAADSLILELGLTKKTIKEVQITIVSSPLRCCLETSAILAHCLGVTSIRVHYGVGDSLEETRRSGYDYDLAPLYLSEGDMQMVLYDIVSLLTPLIDLDIERVSGVPAELYELDGTARMTAALDEIRSELSHNDEHCIVVTHDEVIKAAAIRFTNSPSTIVYDVKDCAFLSIASASENSSWVFAKSGVCMNCP